MSQHEKEKSPVPVVVHGGKLKADAPAVRATEAVPAPLVTGLLPASAAVGDPSFVLRVLGTAFDRASVIIFAGNDEPTTYFSDEELQTGMNMPLWLGADQLSVQVRNGDGQTSNTVTFDLQPPRAVPIDPADASKPSPEMRQI